MHINLIVGFIFLLALGWFIHEMLEHQRAKKAQPADLLKSELEKRRTAQEQSRKASERLAQAKNAHADEIMAVVNNMAEGLKNDSHKIVAKRKENEIELILSYKNESDVFHLEWNVKNFDLEFFSGSGSLKNLQGDYIIRMPGGSMLREPDLTSFTRTLSGLIADRLA